MYDCIIIGAGPAGISAGIYAARASMKTIIIEKGTPGGLIAKTDEIANYPGVEDVPTGSELIERMIKQAKSFGAEFITDTVINVDLFGTTKVVYGENDTYEGKSVIIATGSNPRLLNVPGEKEFTGKGIAYCATCDAPFFQDLDIYVVGSGEAAVEEAMYLTKFGRSVTLLVRKDKLSVAKSIEEKALKCEKLSIIWNVEVESFEGSGILGAMNIVNNKTGEIETFKTDGIFVAIGRTPNTKFLEGKVEIDDRGYIITKGKSSKTSTDGIFAAGDVQDSKYQQAIIAAGSGAIAGLDVEEYLRENNITDIREKFKSLFVQTNHKGDKVFYQKPMTFMNLSGEAVGEAVRFFKLDPETDLFVIYDDMDMPFGKLKIKQNGSAGGHNGIKSIISHVGNEFARIKFGIGKPETKEETLGFVLGKFSPEEKEIVKNSREKIFNLIDDIKDDMTISRLMNKYNTK